MSWRASSHPPLPPSETALHPALSLRAELAQQAQQLSAVELVNHLLDRAFEQRATDVHLDPREDGLHVRLRLDGVLHDVLTLESPLAAQVVSRIKLMAGMDITEKRLAQDGHISRSLLRHDRDIRVGGGPTILGERLVLRLMPDGSQLKMLDELGFHERQLQAVQRALAAPHGMVLSVGPVGCGKSTTIYACLGVLNDPGLSLASIEDPVERRVPGVNQIQIEPKAGFGFPEALRGVLRQDPNVLMVGEVRDPETAHIAVRAGLTGIRVLSTMHAGNCAAAIDMLREFEIPPMFVADAVGCVIAQRLLRKICPLHREYYRPDPVTAQELGLTPEEAVETQLARGCPAEANFHTGYLGRTGVFEVMRMESSLRQAILDGRPAAELEELASRNGMATLRESAIDKVLSGVTTVEEMHRVLLL